MADAELPEHINETIAALAELHAEHQRSASALQRLANRLTNLVGHPVFLAALVLAGAAWVAANLVLRRDAAFDPAPFDLLGNLCGVLGLVGMVLILIAQRHETELADQREQLALQLAIQSDQKSAKLIQLLEELRRDLPSVRDRPDAEAAALSQPSDPKQVFDAIKATGEDEPSDGAG